MGTPSRAEPAVERRIVTVVFADLVGSTSLAEGLDSEDVATLQDAYFASVRETVTRYGGELEKFIGDAAFAVFGRARTREDDAERAVRAALALTSAVEQVGARFALADPSLRIRVGVNTGEVVVGREDALATGDMINVAARLQTAAAPGAVVVGETTALAVADAIELEPLEPLDLKGKSEPVRASVAVALRAEQSRDHAMGRLQAPMLGREEDMRLLEAAVAEGVPRLVLVAAPGVGKTRFTSEFASRVDMSVLRARLRPDVLAPYQPVAQLLSAALVEAGIPIDQAAARSAIRERVTASAARIAVVEEALVGVIWPRSAEEPSSASGLDRDALFEAWLDGIRALATHERPMWLVEDVHWAGGDLLAFLQAAGDRGDAFVLATARPQILEQAAVWCADATVHDLPPLSLMDASDLVRALVGGAMDAALVESIAERSDGNALFIEELLRMWISVGVLADADGRLVVDPGVTDVPLPPTVQAIYAAQIDDLPAGARQVARRAAVAGRRFAHGALAPLGIEDPESGVGVLERRALVAAGPTDPLLGATHVFRHALLRDAGYATLARAERARLHVALADWLEQVAGERWPAVAEVVARHYAAALEATPRFAAEVAPSLDATKVAQLAGEWFERAAKAALDLSAHEAARALLNRALELTAPELRLDRARRLQLLGEATAFAADMDEGAEAMGRALALYRELSHREGISRAGHELGLIRLEQVRFQDAFDLANELLSEIGESDDPDTALLLVLRGAAAYALTNDLRRSEPDIDRAVRVAEAAGDEALELAALAWRVVWHSPEPEFLEHLDIDRTAALAERAGRWNAVAGAHESQAMLLVMSDRAAEATAAIARMEEVAAAHGITEALAWADYLRCEQQLLLGNWDEGRAAGLRALDLADAHAYARAAIRTWMAVSALADARRDEELLERLHGWLVPRAPMLARVPSPFAQLMYEAMLVRLADVGLEVEQILRDEPLAPTFAVPFRQPAWFAGADRVFQELLRKGEIDEATAAVEHFAGRNREWSSEMSLGFENLLRARLLAAGQDSAAQEEAERAQERFRAASAPWWIAQALRLLARDAEAKSIEHRLGVSGPTR